MKNFVILLALIVDLNIAIARQRPIKQVLLGNQNQMDILGSAYIINDKREVLTLNVGIKQFNDGKPQFDDIKLSTLSRWKIDYINYNGKYPTKCFMEILDIYGNAVNVTNYSFLEGNMKLLKEDWARGILDLAILWPEPFGNWPRKGWKYPNGETPLKINIRFNPSGEITSITGSATLKAIDDDNHLIKQTFQNYEKSTIINVPFELFGRPKS